MVKGKRTSTDIQSVTQNVADLTYDTCGLINHQSCIIVGKKCMIMFLMLINRLDKQLPLPTFSIIASCLICNRTIRIWRYQRGIQSRISNNRQHNCQKKEYKRTNNDLQNIRIKLQIETRTPLSVYDKWIASVQQETIDLTEYTDTLFAYKNCD